MELKGSIQGTANAAGVTGVITEIRFSVALAAGGQNLDLTPGTTMIMYTDDRQNKMFGSTSGFTVAGLGRADSDNLLERNEIYEITMPNLHITGAGDNALTYPLGVNKTFMLEVLPPKGSVLQLERTTPIFMDLINFLK